jgi:hypothetical protein
MHAAYKQACADAEYEDGHSGYSGTIATTNGILRVVQQPMTRSGALFYAGQVDGDTLEKWGPAHAIPVAGDERFTFTKKKFTIELPVRQAVLNWDDKPTGQMRDTTEWDLHQAAGAEAQKLFGTAVHDVAVTAQLKAKAVAEPTPGTPVTRYEVAGYRNGPRKLYTTKAQAVKAAGEQLLKSSDFPKLSVQPVKYWPDSDTTDAVVVRKETVSAKATVEVTLAKAERPLVDGWLFFGTAAS